MQPMLSYIWQKHLIYLPYQQFTLRHTTPVMPGLVSRVIRSSMMCWMSPWPERTPILTRSRPPRRRRRSSRRPCSWTRRSQPSQERKPGSWPTNSTRTSEPKWEMQPELECKKSWASSRKSHSGQSGKGRLGMEINNVPAQVRHLEVHVECMHWHLAHPSKPHTFEVHLIW